MIITRTNVLSLNLFQNSDTYGSKIVAWSTLPEQLVNKRECHNGNFPPVAYGQTQKPFCAWLNLKTHIFYTVNSLPKYRTFLVALVGSEQTLGKVGLTKWPQL